MPIDFHDPANRHTYAGRSAHESWRRAILELLDPTGLDVADVGCGGGTYSRAWHELGAASVTGVDFSAEMLAAAREDQPDGVTFVQGDAAATGLPTASVDVVFERALVHHVPDTRAVAREALRILRPGGTYLVQDRTLEDIGEPAGREHVRGYILERFPRLLDVEARRRPTRDGFLADLRAAGFDDASAHGFRELRRVHPSREALLEELRDRTGRSILHDLDDEEIAALVEHLRDVLPADEPISEGDRWTLWVARAPSGT